MTTLTLLTGQVSQITFVPAGSRVTSSGSGSIEWMPGTPTDAANAPNWTTWAKGSSAGYMDALRPMSIRATATGAMTVTIEEGVNDKYAETAYWEEDYPVLSTDSNGNTVLAGAGGGELYAVVTVAPSGDVTGATDAVNINAALSASSHVKLITGDYYINDTLLLEGPYTLTGYSRMGNTLSGNGIGETRITMTTEGIPAIQKGNLYNAIACNLEGFLLVGPGTGDIDTVGYMAETVGGGNYVRDVFIQGFATGLRLYDDTLTKFENVQIRACVWGVQLGYNADIILFDSCRIQECTGGAVFSGWTDATHDHVTTGNNPITFLNCRFGKNAVTFDFSDYNSTCFSIIGCYFEDETKVAWLGSAAYTTSAPKKVVFQQCHFEWPTVTPAADLIEYRNPYTAISDLTISKCECSKVMPAGIAWVVCGINTALEWDCNNFPDTDVQVDYYTGAAQHFSIRGLGTSSVPSVNLRTCMQQLMYADAVTLGKASVSCQLTNGTNAVFAEFKRLASNTGILAGEQATVADVDGKWVVFKGVHQLISPAAALPTAAATYRGCMAYQSGGAGVADTVKCCMKSAADTYSWATVVTG